MRSLLDQDIEYVSIHLFIHSTNIYSVPSAATKNDLISADGKNLRKSKVRMRN